MAQTLSQTPLEEEILKDHEELKEYYDNYKRTGDIQWYNEFVFELSRHSVGEELVLYPLMETLGEEGKRLADESREEHHKAKELLSNLEKMTKGPKEDFDNAFDQLMSDLRDHMDKEERGDLQLIKDRCSVQDRNKYGKKFQFRKKIVPTRPHPMIPEKPVLLEEAMGLMLAPIDKFRDLFRSFPDE